MTAETLFWLARRFPLGRPAEEEARPSARERGNPSYTSGRRFPEDVCRNHPTSSPIASAAIRGMTWTSRSPTVRARTQACRMSRSLGKQAAQHEPS